MSGLRVRVPLTMLHADTSIGPGWWTFEIREYRGEATDDMAVIEEVMVQDVYHLRGLDVSDWQPRERSLIGQVLGSADERAGATVIDLGAHIGAFTATCLQMGAAKVIAVEPDAENAELLRQNTAMGGDRVEVWACAVSADGGPREMEGYGAQAHSVRNERGEILSVTLSQILDPLARVTVLKCDIEGAEYDALLACPHEQLAKVDRIVMEWHGEPMCPWVGPAPIGSLLEHLAETHSLSVIGKPSEGGGMLWAHRNDL